MRTREEQAAAETKILVKASGLKLGVAPYQSCVERIIQEAEQRARAECAADTRRLDWLGMQDVVIGYFGADKWKEVCLARYQRSMPADLADIRITIDAAMEGGE